MFPCSVRSLGYLKKSVVVIGIGNLIMKDDGVGIHVVRALADCKFPAGIDLKIIDGGLEPDLAVLIDEGVNKLILVDAVQAGGQPGEIYRFLINEVANSGYQTRSAHYLNMQQSLQMMKLMGNLPPEIVVAGIEPADMTPGMELSPQIKARLPAILELVQTEISANIF